MAAADGRPEPGTPFRILVLGDFSGRTHRGEPAAGPAGRRVVPVDRDSLDAVMARMKPEIHLDLGGGAAARVPFAFAAMEDFHPDRLWASHGLFQRLRRLRARLAGRETFAAAAAEFRRIAGAGALPAGGPPPAPVPSAAPRVASAGGDLLGDALGESERRGVGRTGLPETAEQWDALVDSIVGPALAPLVLPGKDPRQDEVLARFDEFAGGRLREVLHAPRFQALEASWRSVQFLVDRLETDASLQVHLLDVAPGDAFADLPRGEPVERSALWKIVVEGSVRTPGADPWSAIVADRAFAPAPADVLALLRLGRVAAGAGAPLLAAASPAAVECRSLAETPDPDDWGGAPPDGDGLAAWEALRALPEARWIALLLPRVLLRAPYGKESVRVEEFDFAEMGPVAEHRRFLWGNAAFALAYLLGDTFARSGWDMDGMRVEISRLPVFVHDDDGEQVVKPCGEALLTERAAMALLDRGLVPFVTVRGTDSVRLLGLRAFGEPRGTIRGRWE